MLNLKRLTLENFGPFKGKQFIEFNQEPGVVILYGENMRGKTTLLNAIRYAFYGYVTGRGEIHIDLEKIGNIEAASEGQYGFKVILDFEHDGQQFELTRFCKLRPGVAQPASSDDYVQDSILRRGSDVLGPDQRNALLATILPERVSRFFLFDGELLQQYEELLREESTMGAQIKDAIERILGLPVLTNARADLSDLLEDAQAQEAKVAQKDQRTRELGKLQQGAIETRLHHQRELQRMQGSLDLLRVDRLTTEAELRKSERAKALLIERDSIHNALVDIDEKIKERQARMRDSLGEAWRWFLLPKITALSASIDNQVAALRQSELSHALNIDHLTTLEAAISSGSCDACARPLDDSALGVLREKAQAIRNDIAKSPDTSALTNLIQQQVALKEFPRINNIDVVKELTLSIEDYRIDAATKKNRIEDIKEQTKDLDESKIRKLATDYDRIVQDMAILEAGVRAQEVEFKKVDESIRRIQGQLDKIGGADLEKARRRREICESLHGLFGEAVGEFRDRLRLKVESDATNLFLHLTTEVDYGRLSINDSYGLTIVHKDGTSVPVRSAGAEHIVALSLMGALQKNAPLRGPIIMDSPFGRLDEGHTTHVVKTLPEMANQVFLLVYEAELDKQLARKHLQTNLRREYKLVRKSARHSEIELLSE